ncbi:MAG TPA: carbonic anhydrase family protein [Vicinamibacteria bacterium]|nr:carbonic anhydrase family protein [Vicinamibacteria bacterium]
MSKRVVHSARWWRAAIPVGIVVVGLAVGQHAARAAQAPAPAHPAHAPHWSYEGAEDPSHWASLSPEFAVCGSGRWQSPIDIVTSAATPLQPGAAGFEAARLETTDTRTVPVDVVNNGHTIQVDAVGSDVLVIGDERYVLQQFHFHTPSEHTVDGRSYPLEVHFVHRSAGGKLAVVGLLFEEGAENAALTPYWSRMPKSAGPPVDLGKGGVDVRKVLPARLDVYRYAGSLTTPPCSEGVNWLVLKEHKTASTAQIEAFRALMRHDNRPVQPLGGRAIHSDVIR